MGSISNLPKFGEGLKEITVKEQFVLKLLIEGKNVNRVQSILIENVVSFSFEETVHKRYQILRMICTTKRAEVIKQLIKGLYAI